MINRVVELEKTVIKVM